MWSAHDFPLAEFVTRGWFVQILGLVPILVLSSVGACCTTCAGCGLMLSGPMQGGDLFEVMLLVLAAGAGPVGWGCVAVWVRGVVGGRLSLCALAAATSFLYMAAVAALSRGVEFQLAS